MAVNYINSVPKLVGRENYDEWCFALENVFVLEGLTNCLDGSETDATIVAKGKSKLILTIDPSLYVHVKEARTCKEAWDKIKNLYEDVGFTRKIGLLRTLISLRLNNSESMEVYINQVIETAQKLRKTGFDINEEWVGSLLLAGLPEKYSPMLMAIEHAGIPITTDSIKTKLLDLQTDGSSGQKTGAFAVRGGNFKKQSKGGANCKFDRSQSDKQMERNKVICYKCKQPGHFMSKCPNKFSKTEEKYAFSAVFLSGKYSINDFYLDSGASRHMSPNESLFTNKRTANISEIIVANQQKLSVKHSGDIDITTSVNQKYFNITVNDVLCVPNLSTNLLSVSELISRGNRVSFSNYGCSIYTRDNKLVATADLINGVYKLNLKAEQCMLTTCDSSELWHRRLGHINSQDLNKMKHCVNGLMLKGSATIDKSNCIICCEGKQTRLPFSTTGTRSKRLLEIIHGDVCGPMEVMSIGGSKYFLLLVDDFSRMSFVYFIKSKSDVFQFFKQFKTSVEKQLGRKIKMFRSDQGGEFCGNQFESFLRDEGIIHQKTNAYTPEQNGLAERLNRTLVEKARCLLFDANLHKKFWAEAVNTANYLRNRCIANGLEGKTPYEIWFSKKPDVSMVRIFGSTVMAHVPKEKRLKFDKKSSKHILVGYSDNIKGYRIYNPEKNTITTSRDVIIYENLKTNKQNFSESNIVPEISDQVGEIIIDVQESNNDSSNSIISESLFEDEDIPVVIDITDHEYKPNLPETVTRDEEVPRRSERQRKEKQFTDYVTYMSTTCMSKADTFLEAAPVTMSEAFSRPDSSMWKEAMQHELKCLVENKTWEVVDYPENSAVVESKWVFKVKLDKDNKKTYRARLVAKGFTQKEGVDFHETFSPVVRHSTLRLLIALSVNMGLDIFHLDVTTAFLHGHLKETVYMEQPEGFIKKENEGKVLKLNRAIYGLKQSSRVWYKKVEEVLTNLGYKTSNFEPCVFIKNYNDSLTIIALYVDDFFIFSNDHIESENLKKELSNNFQLKDLGQAKQILGMNICIDKVKNVITLDQTEYIDTLLLKFNMVDCKTVETPMEKNLNLNRNKETSFSVPYQQLIGSLMYLSVMTRPDISYSVSYLSQFNNCFNNEHWQHAKRLLKYLKKTKDHCLVYKRNSNSLEGFVDADWGSNILDRRSYTGFCFTFSKSLVSWESTKQKTVALSSTEAEYMALTEATKEGIYLQNLLNELTNYSNGVILYSDNQSALKLASNPVFHKRSKHIDVRHHFIRETIESGKIKTKYLESNEMPADILTKALGSNKHYKFMNMLGIISKFYIHSFQTSGGVI